MNVSSLSLILKFFLYGYGQPFLIFKPFIFVVPAFAKMIGNPEAILTSTIAILSLVFGLIGAVAAIGAMPAVRSVAVDRWMAKKFVSLTKYQRQRNYPTFWIAESLGIFLFFFLGMRAENRTDPILTGQAIFLLSFLWIVIWKSLWTFISFAVPTFLFRSFAASDKIRNLQKRFGVGFVGFKNNYRLRHSNKLFWLGVVGAALSFFGDENHQIISHISSAIVGVAVSFPILATLMRPALECRQLRGTLVGKRVGALAMRWILISASPCGEARPAINRTCAKSRTGQLL